MDAQGHPVETKKQRKLRQKLNQTHPISAHASNTHPPHVNTQKKPRPPQIGADGRYKLTNMQEIREELEMIRKALKYTHSGNKLPADIENELEEASEKHAEWHKEYEKKYPQDDKMVQLNVALKKIHKEMEDHRAVVKHEGKLTFAGDTYGAPLASQVIGADSHVGASLVVEDFAVGASATELRGDSSDSEDE
jgi:hypothetical protein